MSEAGTALGTAALDTPDGRISSDAALVLVNDFPIVGQPQLDLRGRSWVRLDLPPGEPGYEVQVSVGLYTSPVARPTAQTITARVFDGPTEVARLKLSGQANTIQRGFLRSDRITAVQIDGGNGALIELCWIPVTGALLRDWQPVDMGQPITLPVRHPDYPANAGPIDLAASQQRGLDRVKYGSPARWAGTSFASLHAQFIDLVAGGPAIAMADPSRAATNIPPAGNQATPGVEEPRLASLHPLDVALLSSVYVPLAQIVGLAVVDVTAQAGIDYDYLLVADHSNAGAGVPHIMLTHLGNQGFVGVDGWICFYARRAPVAALAASATLVAYALPGGTSRANGDASAPPKAAAGSVALSWPVTRTPTGHLSAREPVLYHVWRDDQGNGPTPVAAAPRWLTQNVPLAVVSPAGIPQQAVPAPSGWPPAAPSFVDFALDEGWYGYRITGLDLFGRFSGYSPYAVWWQWAPEPDPRPWYYTDPPADRVVHPLSVRILDKEPPPAPAALQAWALDPADPLVVVDAPYAAWRQALPAVTRNTLVGLRVRWRWLVPQHRQAPDVTEFRVYYEPGIQIPTGWQSVAVWNVRCLVCAYADHVTVDADGNRAYEVFIPTGAAPPAFAGGIPLTPTVADPIAYAQVTVTAADATAHSPDRWPGAGPLANRPGNESAAAPPRPVLRVWRKKPDPPVPVVDSPRAYATPADWHGRSYRTFRWRPSAPLAIHVLRAMDDAVFTADWAQQPRTPLTPAQASVFPDPVAEPLWTTAKRQAVCDELNPLAAFPRTADGRRRAQAAYRALSDDALRVLAGLDGNEAAFTQITLEALDGADARWSDRRGPDDAADYAARADVRVWQDTLDGRSTNRFLYRAVAVDPAQNRSAPGPCGTPVRLPDVTPPRTPVVTSVLAGEQQVTIAWASNRELDLLEYRVFRADSREAADDLRLMRQIGVVAADADPTARPARVTFVDGPVRGLRSFFYRVVAVDRTDPVDPRGGGGNLSTPTPILQGRAVDTTPPNVPVWVSVQRVADAQGPAVELRWQTDEPEVRCDLQRRQSGGAWRMVAKALPAADAAAPLDFVYLDRGAPSGTAFEYRVVAVDAAGNRAADYTVQSVEA